MHETSGATSDEIADLFGEAAEEIQRLGKELAEALYRNQLADQELRRLTAILATIEQLAEYPEAPWDVAIYDLARTRSSAT